MITSFVRDGQAYLRCVECGAESIILKYEIVPQHSFPVINHEKTIEGIQSFKTKHALCKNPYTQLEIEMTLRN